MTTKNLARSAIEGGRINRYKSERIESLRTVRRASRAEINCLASRQDPVENFLDLELPDRKKSSLWKGEKFKDKLNPVNRWMETRVGLLWNETYSLLRSRFDVRTTPGRHILFDHMVDQVWVSQDRSAKRAEYHPYYVDEMGILCKTEESPYYKTKAEYRRLRQMEKLPTDLDRVEKDKILKWLGNGRKIGWVGNQYFWYVPVRTPPKNIQFSWSLSSTLSKLKGYGFSSWGYYNRSLPAWGWYYAYVGAIGTSWEVFNPTYRQDKAFSKDDLEFFFTLSVASQKLLQRGRPRSSQELEREYRRYRAEERLRYGS